MLLPDASKPRALNTLLITGGGSDRKENLMCMGIIPPADYGLVHMLFMHRKSLWESQVCHCAVSL